MVNSLSTALGALCASEYTPAGLARSVKDAFRDGLIAKPRDSAGKDGQLLFSCIVGYEDTVVPQIVNVLLSTHNSTLLDLRGEAKNRILRSLTTLLGDYCAYLAGAEMHDDLPSNFLRDLTAKFDDDTSTPQMTSDDPRTSTWQIEQRFNLGGAMQLPDEFSAATSQKEMEQIQGSFREADARRINAKSKSETPSSPPRSYSRACTRTSASAAAKSAASLPPRRNSGMMPPSMR